MAHDAISLFFHDIDQQGTLFLKIVNIMEAEPKQIIRILPLNYICL
jgi:hypothetical protein